MNNENLQPAPFARDPDLARRAQARSAETRRKKKAKVEAIALVLSSAFAGAIELALREIDFDELGSEQEDAAG